MRWGVLIMFKVPTLEQINTDLEKRKRKGHPVRKISKEDYIKALPLLKLLIKQENRQLALLLKIKSAKWEIPLATEEQKAKLRKMMGISYETNT